MPSAEAIFPLKWPILVTFPRSSNFISWIPNVWFNSFKDAFSKVPYSFLLNSSNSSTVIIWLPERDALLRFANANCWVYDARSFICSSVAIILISLNILC